MKHPGFLLSMQPRFVDSALDGEEEEDEEEQKSEMKLSASIHSGSFVANSTFRGEMDSSRFDNEETNLVVISKGQHSKRTARGKNTTTGKSKMMHPEELALQDSMLDRWYIIPKRGKFREYWDYIVMTIAIYNCIWTPLTISFDWAID